MTVSAQCDLAFLVEGLVAAVALLFIFRMALDYLAWHHQGFYASCPCIRHCKPRYDCDDSQTVKNQVQHNMQVACL